MVTNHLRGKKFQILLMTVIPLLVFIITLSVWHFEFNFLWRISLHAFVLEHC